MGQNIWIVLRFILYQIFFFSKMEQIWTLLKNYSIATNFKQTLGSERVWQFVVFYFCQKGDLKVLQKVAVCSEIHLVNLKRYW